MNGIIVTLFAVAALANAGSISLRPNGCPVDFNVHAQLSHENCNKFYLCAFGTRVAKKCPDGLLYNPEQELCDWPHNVECGDRILPEVSDVEPNSPEAICRQPSSDLVLLEHEFCNKFYKCINNTPFEYECSAGLMYNTELQICDWAYNVQCKSRV